MKVVVLGASDNPERYAYKAMHRLSENGHDAIPVGIKKAEVAGKQVITSQEPINDAHTITLYVGLRNQPSWYEFIMKSNPERIIFNPGTENPELKKMAEEKGIETVEACTLVMLATGQFE